MKAYQTFENTIYINASATAVEKCFTDLELMHRWLNPALRCEPVGEWSTDVGGRSRFLIQIPLLQPKLYSQVVERDPGLIVWQFEGFFQGRDRWECYPEDGGTRLLNRFEFKAPNPLIKFGFETFASKLTQKDMKDQLKRLKRVAEEVYLVSGRVR
ncbi:MAG: SRPBCC family protein [Elainellaceae cyanobacterium]